MQQSKITDLSKFFVVGINYKKTDAAARGLFAVDSLHYEQLLQEAESRSIRELFVLSTCNRTEIYGFAEEAAQLTRLLCLQNPDLTPEFIDLSYTKNGAQAIRHLFYVGAGLDSQILGDYEIVGQIKQAVKFAKERNKVGAFLERLVNAVLQSSKEVKNKTALSGGTVSVSFAAVQYIRERITDPDNLNILLLGTGKIGKNTCKNLIDYLGTRNITLINRTAEKAASLAGELRVKHAPLKDLDLYLREAAVIVVATSAPEPAISRSQLENKGAKLILDLSIPCNVEKEAGELPHITLVNVDTLSSLKDETLEKRKAEVPKAKAIIQENMTEFLEWHQMRKIVPVLKAVKNKLEQMGNCRLYTRQHIRNSPAGEPAIPGEAAIQKVISNMALKMRRQNQQGCHYIEAINDYIARGVN